MAIAKLSVDLVANTATWERNLASMAANAESSSRRAAAAMGALRSSAVALFSGLSAGQFIAAADAVTVLQNQLKLATGSTQAAGVAYEALFDIAQRSRVSFTELGSTYASIARAGESLGLSQQSLLTVTEAIGNAMTISGGSAAGMQAALVQLSQGLASGQLRGEELNSVMEQTPRLARALADGLGVTTGQLREMGKAGKLSAEQVIAALQSQAATLRGEVAGAAVTVGQAMTTLQNSATRAVGELDRVSGTSASLAGSVSTLARSLDDVASAFKAVDTAGQPVDVLGRSLSTVLETVAVLGSNVAFVFKAVGTEVGVLAAQASAAARLQFSEAAEIGRMARADAERNRREIDALTQRILGARAAGDLARRALSDNAGLDTRAEDRRLGLSTTRQPALPGSTATKPVKTAAQKAPKDTTRENDLKAGELRNRLAGEAAADALREAERAADAYARRLENLIGDTPIAKTQALLDNVRFLDGAFFDGALTAEQHKQAIDLLTGSTKALSEVSKDYSDGADKDMQRLIQATEGWGRAFTDTLADMVTTGKADFRGLADSIVADLTRIQIQKRITDPLVKAGTDLLDFALGEGNFLSFAGGGYTGSGPRSGGLDGQGGYLAMLHPRETVLDHTRPMPQQAGGGTVVVNQSFNFNGPADRTQVMTAAQLGAAMARSQMRDDMQRGRL